MCSTYAVYTQKTLPRQTVIFFNVKVALVWPTESNLHFTGTVRCGLLPQSLISNRFVLLEKKCVDIWTGIQTQSKIFVLVLYADLKTIAPIWHLPILSLTPRSILYCCMIIFKVYFFSELHILIPFCKFHHTRHLSTSIKDELVDFLTVHHELTIYWLPTLMHWLLLFSSTCFEPQVLICRRLQYICSIWQCHSLREFVVACRYTARMRTDCRGKVVGGYLKTPTNNLPTTVSSHSSCVPTGNHELP